MRNTRKNFLVAMFTELGYEVVEYCSYCNNITIKLNGRICELYIFCDKTTKGYSTRLKTYDYDDTEILMQDIADYLVEKGYNAKMRGCYSHYYRICVEIKTIERLWK